MVRQMLCVIYIFFEKDFYFAHQGGLYYVPKLVFIALLVYKNVTKS
jgi:hypothetical protein